MNKRGWVIAAFAVVFMLFLGSFAIAAANDSTTEATTSGDNIDKAYICLENQIKNRNLSLEEAVFSALALGAKGGIVDRIETGKDGASCWPKGACKVKETAQVALAYKRMNKDISAVKKWLLSKNSTATELKWLLEIDITSKLTASCKINDGQRESTIKILENGRLQGSLGTCLSIDSEGYMLRINSNCQKNEFTISCDQDFVTSVLYQKTAGGTLFVLPEAHSAASLGQTKERARGDCFKSAQSCDYEGSLWAALALQKIGEDVSVYTPYLLAFADDNIKYFPSAFLYILVGGDDQYNLIIQQQKQGKFWEMTATRGGRYYDTSLALLGLADKGGAEIDATKEYLLSIQTKDGCWDNNNIRNTAFLLYAGWPKGVVSAGQVSSPPSCEPQFSCENLFDCNNAQGIVEQNYACSKVGEICCSVKVAQQTCEQKKGLLCPSGTQCDGRVESASDGNCCFDGKCIEIAQAEDTCTSAGGTCRTSCESGESETSEETCAATDEVCCMKKGSSLWVWIIVLLILITLAVLAIVYREKLKIWWFKLLEKFKKKPAAQSAQRPGAPFAPSVRPMMPQPMMPQRAPIRPVARDKEMEEALRKLREMSKK